MPFKDTEDVFRKCSSAIPGRLRRIPDGETGDRIYFVQFQRRWFQAAPEMIPEFKMNAELVMRDFTPEQVKEGIEKILASPRKTGYDDAAIASYQDFKRLRDEGVLPKETKFQVSIPTHINAIMGFAMRDFQADIEPIYKESLLQAMRNIQDAIPHEDLAFQIDIASEYIFLENIAMYRPWFYKDDKDFDKRKEYIYDYIINQLGVVDQDVDVGLHNCYGRRHRLRMALMIANSVSGDMAHTHFKEPDSLALIVETNQVIFDRTPHPIKFFQCPVPPSAMDKLDYYYEPLKELLPKFKENGTELYLGVVREDDLEGTKARVEAAKKAFPDTEFGVATECGLGRVSPEQAESVLKIASEVSEPVM